MIIKEYLAMAEGPHIEECPICRVPMCSFYDYDMCPACGGRYYREIPDAYRRVPSDQDEKEDDNDDY